MNVGTQVENDMMEFKSTARYHATRFSGASYCIRRSYVFGWCFTEARKSASLSPRFSLIFPSDLAYRLGSLSMVSDHAGWVCCQ
jgi:hypothetical protein